MTPSCLPAQPAAAGRPKSKFAFKENAFRLANTAVYDYGEIYSGGNGGVSVNHRLNRDIA